MSFLDFNSFTSHETLSHSIWSALSSPGYSENALSAHTLLDFFHRTAIDTDLLLSAHLTIRYNYREFAGEGGTYIVEIWQHYRPIVEEDKYPELIAVKRPKFASPEIGAVTTIEQMQQHNIEKALLETRIMTHQTLKDHRNILTLLGFGWEPLATGGCGIYIGVEYSALGQLDQFLRDKKQAISADQKRAACTDVALGLEILHACGIAHADVKAENMLVFNDTDGGYIVKLADFGQALFETESRLSGPYLGSPFFLPPEIQRALHKKVTFDIEAAKMCDIFCYGLLVWEVFKEGVRYFEDSWFSPSERNRFDSGSLDIDFLLQKGYQFINSLSNIPTNLGSMVRGIFERTLRDNPSSREPMKQLLDIWHLSTSERMSPPNDDIQLVVDNRENPSLAVKINTLDLGVSDFRYLPWEFGEYFANCLSELATKAQSTSSVIAALELAFCYIVGLGVEIDKIKMLHWLHIAEEQGSVTAISLSRRLHRTFRSPYAKVAPPPTEEGQKVAVIEEQLDGIPSPLYYSSRIRAYQKMNLELQRSESFIIRNQSTLKQYDFTLNDRNHIFHIIEIEKDYLSSLFVITQQRKLRTAPYGFSNVGILHFFSFHGEVEVVESLVRSGMEVNQLSQNVTPIICACMGGQSAIVRILLTNGADATICAKIEPLWRGTVHFAPMNWLIMFDKLEVRDIALGLLGAGAAINLFQSEVKMPEHFVSLGGTPIHFATTIADESLVSLLLELGAHRAGDPNIPWSIKPVTEAISQNLPKIATLLAIDEDRKGIRQGFQFFTERLMLRPVFYWLMHGEEYQDSFRETLKFCHNYGFQLNQDGWVGLMPEDSGLGISDLMEDFVRILLEEGADLNYQRLDSASTILYSAVNAAQRNFPSRIVTFLIGNGANVNEPNSGDRRTPLHAAAHENKIHIAKTLLEHGADVQAQTRELETALHIAARTPGNAGIIELLLQCGINSLVRNNLGRTALRLAITECHPPDEDSISLLLSDNRLTSTVLDEETGDTCLHLAVRQPLNANSIFVLTTLIKHSKILLDIDLENALGHCALYDAALALQPVYLRALLAEGASLLGTPEGKPLLLERVLRQSRTASSGMNSLSQIEKVASIILEADQQTENPQFSGITSLHIAMYLGLFESAEKLSRSGIDVNSLGKIMGAECEESALNLWERTRDKEKISSREEEACMELIRRLTIEV